ncbi:hypothetical protein CDAR_242551 [Caerostris darwini]|uniref:Uncharacterized protein n=1 Tax=Caerostris darwini TaxID=1538125 RepID=A0AAV4P2B7_9ARAC|nr:hypothetical protein CDAR_211401 [Caerostris darwini]GIX95037.1 hypothetical protein CDAR_475421 [Caerostris darwini]GIX96648.1 hypothetical protein CDAR_550191 [Caerostris darwini]GIY59154.1 hypothetical protein CDAR_242551 [Caerostris darwini]
MPSNPGAFPFGSVCIPLLISSLVNGGSLAKEKVSGREEGDSWGLKGYIFSRSFLAIALLFPLPDTSMALKISDGAREVLTVVLKGFPKGVPDSEQNFLQA